MAGRAPPPGGGRRVWWALLGGVLLLVVLGALALRPGRSEVAVIFDGQSLNLYPDVGYPERLMQGRGISYSVVAVDGRSWRALALDADDRVLSHADDANTTILVMNGGTSNIDSGQSAVDYYSDEVAYASAARAAGFDLVIVTTLPTSSTFEPAEERARQDANRLKLEDPEEAFDAVADLAAHPLLAKEQDGGYIDGIHWTDAGAQAAAEVVAPVLDRLLAQLG